MDAMSDVVMSSAIEQFCSVTGATDSTARIALEACNWNLELAINMFVDQNDGQPDGPLERNTSNANHTSNTSTNPSNDMSPQSEDTVRPPIPPVRQVLVDDYPSASYSNHLRRANSNSVFDAFRDFESEARWTEQQMVSESSSSSAPNSVTATKRRTLEDLFRPPLDLICRGTLEFAKDEGQRLNKWLMVNIQNHQEFSCQVLNRDVWSNPAVKSIVGEHFIFWQTYHDNSEGQRFMQFYNVVDFPYVAILDPRTGEKLRNWSAIDPVSFCDLVTEFLHDMPSPSGSSATGSDTFDITERKTSSEKFSAPNQALYEESEELQLKAAIAASLQEAVKTDPNANDVEDSDLETFDSDNEENKHNSTDAQINSKSSLNTKESALLTNPSPNGQTEEVVEDYIKYLGPENGSKFELVIRYPDGNRENITFPSDSQLKALFLYLSSKGYNMTEFDLISNFPKRNLKEVFTSDVLTLEMAGIQSRDTLYVQHKT